MKNIKNITLASMIIALIALMAFVPWIGFINVPPIAITLIHVPVILGTVIIKEYKYAFVFGLAFGLLSFIVNSYTPSLTQAIFFNPMVSVFPRLFVGLTSLAAYNLTNNASGNDIFSMIIAAIIGTITNTILVITAISAFGDSTFAAGLISGIKYIITVNGTLEIVAAVILVPAIGKALMKVKR